MKVGNIIALTSIAIVGYAMHAMRSGESSAMGAARGAGREVPSLQQITAKKIAQMLHDREMAIDLADMPKDPQARMEALDTFFHNQTKAIAHEYYTLYHKEIQSLDAFKPKLVQEIEDSGHALRTLPNGGFVRVFADNRNRTHALECWLMGDDNQFRRSQVIMTQNTNNNLISSMAVSSDGNLIAVSTAPVGLGGAGPRQKHVFVYERRSGGQFSLLQDISLEVKNAYSMSRLAIHQNQSSKTLLVQSVNQLDQEVFTVLSWDNERNRFVIKQNILHNEKFIIDIEFDRTGSYFAYTSSAKVEIWFLNLINGLWESKEVLKLSRGSSSFSNVAFTPDSRFILASSRAGIALWSMSKEGPSRKIHDVKVGGISTNISNLNLDGNRFLSINNNQNQWQAILWHMDIVNKTIMPIFTFSGEFMEALFIGDCYILLGLKDKIQIWHVPQPSIKDIWDHILRSQETLERGEPSQSRSEISAAIQ